MRDRLGADLQRWEAGELSLLDLEARHPSQDIGSLVDLHTRLTAFAAEPVPDPEPAWQALSTRLVARPQTTTRRRRPRSRRRVAAGMVAAVVVAPGIAYAAAPDAVGAIAREVTHLLPWVGNADPGAPDDHPVPVSSIPATDRDDSRDSDDIDDHEDTGADNEHDGADPDEGPDDDDEPDGADHDDGLDDDDQPGAGDPDDGLEDDSFDHVEEPEEEGSASTVDDDRREIATDETGSPTPDSDTD